MKINEINAKNGLKTYLYTIYKDADDQEGEEFYGGAKDYNDARQQLEGIIKFLGVCENRFKIQEQHMEA